MSSVDGSEHLSTLRILPVDTLSVIAGFAPKFACLDGIPRDDESILAFVAGLRSALEGDTQRDALVALASGVETEAGAQHALRLVREASSEEDRLLNTNIMTALLIYHLPEEKREAALMLARRIAINRFCPRVVLEHMVDLHVQDQKRADLCVGGWCAAPTITPLLHLILKHDDMEALVMFMRKVYAGALVNETLLPKLYHMAKESGLGPNCAAFFMRNAVLDMNMDKPYWGECLRDMFSQRLLGRVRRLPYGAQLQAGVPHTNAFAIIISLASSDDEAAFWVISWTTHLAPERLSTYHDKKAAIERGFPKTLSALLSHSTTSSGCVLRELVYAIKERNEECTRHLLVHIQKTIAFGWIKTVSFPPSDGAEVLVPFLLLNGYDYVLAGLIKTTRFNASFGRRAFQILWDAERQDMCKHIVSAGGSASAAVLDYIREEGDPDMKAWMSALTR